jgi:hypothetical protein
MSMVEPATTDAACQMQPPAFHLTSISFRLTDTDPTGHGWSLTHPYVETFWLPVIGPTATLMLRFIGRHVTTSSYKVFDPAEVSFCLGVSARTGRHSAMPKTVKRLTYFNLAVIDSNDDDTDYRVTIPPSLPEVPAPLRHKWPEHLRILHTRAIARHHLDSAKERS